MYIALREVQDKGPDGLLMVFKPGEEVTSFGSWPYRNQKAALSQHLVREVMVPSDASLATQLAGSTSDGATDRLRRQMLDDARGFYIRKANENLAQQQVAEAVVEQVELARAIDVSELKEEVVELGSLTDPAAAADDGDSVLAELEQRAPRHACDACAYTAATPAGLKIHKARQHKPTV